MNLPNKLTIARLGLTVLFVVAAYSGLPWGFTAAALLFGVAAFTDYLDGRIARQRGMVTSFGKLMDPLADKVLMAAAFVVIMDIYRDGTTMPAWVVITVLAREFLVTGLRLVASSQGVILAADWLGKQKTAWQIALASYLLVMNAAAREPLMAWVQPLFDSPSVGRRIMVPVLLTITLVVTIWSGASYVWKHRRLVMDEM